MQITVPCTFRRAEPSDSDLDKIRQDAGNPDLTAEQVIVFGKSLIGRSDVPGNRFIFTREALKAAAPTFVGRPVNLDHHDKHASEQVARIFSAWTEDVGTTTYLYVNHYAVRTSDLADVHTRMFNRQHREMSMGAGIVKARCAVCDQDVIAHEGKCPQHYQQDDYLVVVDGFTGEHVSFVGNPAIEGAQLLNARQDEPKPDPASQRLAEDGRLFREWVSAEFSKWYRLNNRDATPQDVTALADKLSAREMMTFARIQQTEFSKIIPAGGQQLAAPEPQEQDVQVRSVDEIKQSFRKGM